MAVEASDVSLVRAMPADEPLLARLLQLYAHDLSDVFALDLDESGCYGYAELPAYFTAPATHHAFLVRYFGHYAGFALATRGSPASEDPEVFDLAEFFVVKRHRRAGLGRRVAFRLWDDLPGRWLVRVSSANALARKFWPGVIADYAGGHHRTFTHPGRMHPFDVYEFDNRRHHPE